MCLCQNADMCWWGVGSLLIQDAIQYAMHVGEHRISPWLYKNSHKPHHHFTNPRLFDAFDVTTSTVPQNPKQHSRTSVAVWVCRGR